MKKVLVNLLRRFRPSTLALLLVVTAVAGAALADTNVQNAFGSIAEGEAAGNGASAAGQVAGTAAAAQQAAADEKAAAAASIAKAMDGVLNMVKNTEAQLDKIRTNDKFNGLGLRLIAVLGTLVFIWNVLKNMALKPTLTQLVADLVFPFVVIAVCLVFVNTNAADQIARFVESLATAFGVEPNAVAFVKQMLDAMGKVWQLHATSGVIPSMAELAGLALEMLAVVFLIVGTVLGVGTLLLAKFQVGLAIALAPIAIPWLLWRNAEFLFSSWLQFLLKSAMVYVAVGAMSSVLNGAVDALVKIFPDTKVVGNDSVMAFGGLAMMSLMIAFLLSKAFEVGSGIISGSASGLGGIGHIAHLGGGIMKTAALKPVAWMAKGGANTARSVGLAKMSNASGKVGEMGRAAAPRQGSFQRLVYTAAGGKQASSSGGASAAPAPSAASAPAVRKLAQPSAWARGKAR